MQKKHKVKKIFFGIGAITLLLSPLLTTISCGDSYRQDPTPVKTLVHKFEDLCQTPITTGNSPLNKHSTQTGIYYTEYENSANEIMMLLSPSESRSLITENKTKIISPLLTFPTIVGKLKMGQTQYQLNQKFLITLTATWSNKNWSPGNQPPKNQTKTIIEFILKDEGITQLIDKKIFILQLADVLSTLLNTNSITLVND